MENLAEGENFFNRLFGHAVNISRGVAFVDLFGMSTAGHVTRPATTTIRWAPAVGEGASGFLTINQGVSKCTSKKLSALSPCDCFNVAHVSDLCFIGLEIKGYLSTPDCSKSLVLELKPPYVF